MTVSISEIHLFNVERNELESAELWDAITEQQLTDWEAEWMPELFRALQRLNQEGVERQYWPQSRYWNWREKLKSLQGMLANPSFSIVCNGLTQGMMIVDTVRYRCRIDSQTGQHLVYVKYVENAPWNRPGLLISPRYRGVGSILIRAGIALSVDMGFHGRIGLHSLPQANNFYAQTCGMMDLGPDLDYENLHYFEMTPQQARAFVKKES